MDGRWDKACVRHAKTLPCAFPKVTDEDVNSGCFMSSVNAKPHLPLRDMRWFILEPVYATHI